MSWAGASAGKSERSSLRSKIDRRVDSSRPYGCDFSPKPDVVTQKATRKDFKRPEMLVPSLE